MGEFDDLVQDLKTKRDELKVQMSLASMELREEWEELEAKMDDFTSKARLGETGEGVGKALGDLGQEIKLGYDRLVKALKD